VHIPSLASLAHEHPSGSLPTAYTLPAASIAFGTADFAASGSTFAVLIFLRTARLRATFYYPLTTLRIPFLLLVGITPVCAPALPAYSAPAFSLSAPTTYGPPRCARLRAFSLYTTTVCLRSYAPARLPAYFCRGGAVRAFHIVTMTR